MLVATLAATARAGVMLSPAQVLGTDLGTYDPTVPLENMINQSGLDKPFTSGVTDFDAYFSTGAPAYGQGGVGNWQSDYSFNLPLMGYVDFDLGAVYMIDRVAVWNRSLETGQFLVSQTLGGPMEVAGSFTLLNRLNFPFSYLPEIVELDEPVQARYVRIEIDSTYKFDPTDTFAYAIVGEVVVDVVPDAAGFAADFDDDGDVDGLDLVEWQGAFGVSGGGDADEDGDSDGEDYLIWQRQLGMTRAVPAASAVPEPGTGLALLAGMLAVVRRARESRD